MTPTQITALRAKVFLDPTASAFFPNRDSAGLRAYLNADAVPAYVVWRTSVGQDEIMLNGFDWARVDNLSVGKARIWEWLFDNSIKSINPSKLNVRAGIDQCWQGTASDLAVRAVIYTHCKRSARVAEKMLATGTGTDVSPSNMDLEGELSDLEVGAIMFKDNGQVWTVAG